MVISCNVLRVTADIISMTTFTYEPRFDVETGAWGVVEVYPGLGETEAIFPSGMDLDDLLATLHLIVTDLEEYTDKLNDVEEELSETCLDCIQSAAYEAGYADGIAAAEERN